MHLLTTDEVQALSALEKESIEVSISIPTLSLAQRALKKRRIGTASEKTYNDSKFTVPTYNICERLFQTARYALTPRRARLSSFAFEQQIFLHLNSDWWNISDVADIVKNDKMFKILVRGDHKLSNFFLKLQYQISVQLNIINFEEE